jgi:SAM-dependent methyltransferase
MTTPLIQTWRDFFDLQAPTYELHEFTKNTLVEVQFLMDVLELRPGMSVLDLGCGTGRHARELAKRGIKVTGVDFSEGMLREARKKSDGLAVEYVAADITTYVHPTAVDAVICICEGGFGLLGHDEDPVAHDLAILRNAAATLRPGGRFCLTALNGYAQIRQIKDEDIEGGAFDPATMILRYRNEMSLGDGQPVQVRIVERQFIPPELMALMHHAGFRVDHLYGGTAGDWGKRPLRLDEIEMMVLAHRA